nr:MAG TPA: hypothetical protein [Caudoviricetes sp.]
MKLLKLSSVIRIIISILILYLIENGTIVSRFNTAIIILCFIELTLDLCYIVINLSIKE